MDSVAKQYFDMMQKIEILENQLEFYKEKVRRLEDVLEQEGIIYVDQS